MEYGPLHDESEIRRVEIPLIIPYRYITVGNQATFHASSARELEKYARENIKNRIFETFGAIEQEIEKIIVSYFFKDITPESSKFTSLILQSDYPFSSKRKLLRHIVTDCELLERKAAESYDTVIGRANSYRNAFTHGRFFINGEKVWLRYFEGEPKEKELNSEYLSQIRNALIHAYETSVRVYAQMEERSRIVKGQS